LWRPLHCFAPLFGALEDNFGIGTALMILAAGVLLLFIFLRVDE